MAQLKRTIIEVRTAKDSPETPEAAIQLLSGLNHLLHAGFLKRLLGQQSTVSFEIASLNQTVYFIVTGEPHHENLLRSQISSQYPTAVITTMDDYLGPWANYASSSVGQLTLSGPSYLPLKTYNKFETTDPLSGVLGVMGKTNPGEAVIFQMIVSSAPNSWLNSGRRAIQRGVGTGEDFVAHPYKNLIEEKIGAKAYHVGLRLLAISPDPTQANSLLTQIASSFGGYSLSEGNSLVLKSPRDANAFIQAMINRSPQFMPRSQYLNVTEIASLFHFPGQSHEGLRNLAWGKTIKGEAPDNLPTGEGLPQDEVNKITFFAKTEFKNHLASFGIKHKDRRRHFYCLGKSGTGKSTLLGNMAISDIQKGQGFAIIDPHGDLIEETLLDHIPDHRLNDVVYLDPSDMAHPFHLNPLETKTEAYKDLAVSNIMSIFTKIWANVWSARMEHILRNTLATLVEVPGTTMLDIPTILTDDKFRESILAQIDPQTQRVIHDFWRSEYGQYNDRFKNEAIAPILNKVGQFIGSPTIRQVLNSPKSTVNVEELMNSKKIVLINLSQGRIGEENSALLGAMFITQFQLAAMNRINVPEEQRQDFFLYVDEFQNFATSSFIKILAEARKYRLGLILANQYIAQLPEEIQQAIFGNIGTIVTFVMGADDANHMMQEFGNIYTQDDLVNLGKFQIITKLSIDDRISNPFPAYTLPIDSDPTPNRQAAIDASHSHYTLSKDQTPTPSFRELHKDDSPITPSFPNPPKKSEPRPDPHSLVQVGEIYSGPVKKIMPYGVFVEIAPNLEGLVHISNMSDKFTKNPEELVKEGDMVTVKLTKIDEQNRLNLSMVLDQTKQEEDSPKKESQPETPPQTQKPQPSPAPRNDFPKPSPSTRPNPQSKPKTKKISDLLTPEQRQALNDQAQALNSSLNSKQSSLPKSPDNTPTSPDDDTPPPAPTF